MNPRLEDFLIILDTQFDTFVVESNFLEIQNIFISTLNFQDLQLFYDKRFIEKMKNQFLTYLKAKGFFNKENLKAKGFFNKNAYNNKKQEEELEQNYFSFLAHMSNVYKDNKNIYAKYLFYLKNYNHERKILSEAMKKIEIKIFDFIKNCSANINSKNENINESTFYEIIVKLLTSSNKIMCNKIIGIDDSFISLFSKHNEPQYYIDSLCFIEGNEGFDSFNFCGHATTNSLSEQGSLFFENPPEFKMKKLFLLKSYTDFNKDEQSLFKNSTDFNKLKHLSNHSKYYFIIYNLIKNKKNIGNRYINTNLIYCMNTYLVFLGDGLCLENNFNNEMFSLFYSIENFNPEARFHYLPIKPNSKLEEKIFYKIKNDLTYILDNIILENLSNDIYSLSNKVSQILEETVKTYDTLHKICSKKIDSRYIKIIDKIKSIIGIDTLNIHLIKNKHTYDFKNSLMINARLNFLPINESEIKYKILNLVAKIINTSEYTYLSQKLINDFMNEIFSVNSENELILLIKKHHIKLSHISYYNKYPINNNEVSLEQFINYIFFDFYYNVKNTLYKEKNTDILFLIFILIFNVNLFENEFFKSQNSIVDEKTYFNFKLIIEGRNSSLKLFWILNALIYPNNNFNHFEEKIELISYLYFELFNSHFEINENKKIIDNYIDIILTEYNKGLYSENYFLLSFLKHTEKYDIKYYPILIMSLYNKTSCNLLKNAIIKFIGSRNHNFIFNYENHHIWKEIESLLNIY